MTIEEKVAAKLIRSKKSLSIAESCTGGLLSNRLTNISGSSEFLKLSVVAYSNLSKSKILKVPVELIKKHGAVSKEVAIAMARGVRKLINSDTGIGITGIAGPTGGTKKKPVGLVYIAINTSSRSLCKKHIFKGTRIQIKAQSVNQSLKSLINLLK